MSNATLGFAAIEGFLASLGSLTTGHLQNVLRVLDGYVATPGPDPTTLEVDAGRPMTSRRPAFVLTRSLTSMEAAEGSRYGLPPASRSLS